MKKILILLFKLGLSGSIIYWLVNSGKLNFQILSEVVQDKSRFIISIILFLTLFILTTVRYLFILRTKVQNITFKIILPLNWIGMFFNAVLPGAVSGDLLKIFYIQNKYPKLSKKFLLGSVVIDRIFGLFGLIISLGLFSILNFSTFSTFSEDINFILYINFALLTCVITGLSLLLVTPEKISNVFKFFIKKEVTKGLFESLLKIWNELSELRSSIVLLTFISTIIQSLAVFTFWYISIPYADNNFDLSIAFSIVPIGFLGIAIPIAPSGLGVGHALFQKLFEVIKVSNGASLFNIYFFFTLMINLFGIIPYLRYSNKKPLKEIQKELN